MYKLICVFLISVLSIQNCFSEILKQDAFFYKEPSASFFLGLCGATYKLDGDTLLITIDQEKVISKIPTALKLHGLMYKESLSYEHLASSPLHTSLVAALQAVSVIIPIAYRDNSNLNQTNAIVSLIHKDIYGRNAKDVLLTFNMNRNLNNKIVWDNFNMRNAVEVFPNFEFTQSNWFYATLLDENKNEN